MDNLEFNFDVSEKKLIPVQDRNDRKAPASAKKWRFSPSALNLFLDCPRCFWLEKKMNIKRPRGIFPSLPGGMDLVIKTYFDKHRLAGTLPPEIDGKVEGMLFEDLDIMERWRSWRRTDLLYKDEQAGAQLSGALDDCLWDDGFYIPLDYKTRGSELKSDPRAYYQNQLDCYCLILEESGFKTKGVAYLVYYWPEEVSEDGNVRFCVTPIRIETNTQTARNTVAQAAELLAGPEPEIKKDCEYCVLVEQVDCLRQSQQ